MECDQSRNANGLPSKPSQEDNIQSDSVTAGGFCDFTNSKRPKKRARKIKNTVPPACPSKLNTFWTSCNQCRMQYEYLRIYLNQNLLCPNCNQAFLAVEIAVPASVANSSASLSSKKRHKNLNHESIVKNDYCFGFSGTGSSGFQHGENYDSHNRNNYQWGTYVGENKTDSTTAVNPSVQTADAIHRKMEKLKRKQEKAQVAARKQHAQENNGYAPNYYENVSSGINYYAYNHEETVSILGRPSKRSISNNNVPCMDRQGVEPKKFTIDGGFEAERTSSAFADCPRARLTARQNSFNREYLQTNARQQIIEKVKLSISNKLVEWDFANQLKLRAAKNLNQGESQKNNANGLVKDCVGGNADKPPQAVGLSSELSTYGRDVRLVKSIDVPDPDFYDFDKDRLVKAFDGDQVWATYDSEDGMPRFYVLVQKVISRKPFKIRISFLNSKSNSEFGLSNWVASGFAKTCGNFRVGRYEVSDTANIFSHRVRWEKGPRGVIRIVPKKGDTWALYRNWSPDWNEFTPDDVIHKYEMVEVLDDYDDENGVSVTPLLKVAGFKAVFHRHLDLKQIRRIPREEMFRFSHQVPSYFLTGEEANIALKGCLEMDPAATPVELLQVITELKDDMDPETNDKDGEV